MRRKRTHGGERPWVIEGREDTAVVFDDRVETIDCRYARGRQAILLNRDIIRLFVGLRVSDSFLLKNNLREILFRKPA